MRLINKASHILFAGLIIAGPGLPQPASAITAELAKKCRAMALKVYPAQRPGFVPKPEMPKVNRTILRNASKSRATWMRRQHRIGARAGT